jgi:Predicted kinase
MQKPTLYLMVGYPGAGKTTTSRIIHKLTGAVHLWADHERSKSLPTPHTATRRTSSSTTRSTNARRSCCARVKSVIFDTNFNFFKDREKLRKIAAAEGAETVLIWVTTPKDIARERAVNHPLTGEHHRVFGNMTLEDFERIANNLEEPRPEEHPIKLEGIGLTEKLSPVRLI